MPLTIVPKGLTPARAQYLYDKVRNIEKVCPKPSPFEQSNAVNPNVIRQGILAREKPADIPGPSCHNSTVPSTCSTEIKRGRQINQDEDTEQMSLRKRRKRSQLKYSYQCPLCPKMYASDPALYLHKKRKHPPQ